jgi:2-polyprenyl-3-methyl-5-hydroxy-6-metoxy-1,4-benzoquinol methylase
MKSTLGSGPGNVSAAELEKFDRLAARWWDPDGESRPLHDLNPVRLDYVRERARLDGEQVLDVGCGGGLLSKNCVNFKANLLYKKVNHGLHHTTANVQNRSN